MLSEQIKGLHEQRTAKVALMEELVEKSESEARSFTDPENEQFETLKSDISDLDNRIKKLEETEKMVAATKAKPIIPESSQRQPITQKDMPHNDPSLFYAKQAHALFVTGGSRSDAAVYCSEVWGDDVMAKVFKLPRHVIQRAAVDPGTSGASGWAAELVQVNQAASAYIDALRAMSVVARFPGMQMSFGGNGSISIPRNAGPSTGGWVGENKAIKVDAVAFDSITLAPLKNANIITASNELLRRSDPAALGIIRDDILRGVATSIDTKFCSDDAASAGVSPAGLQTFDASAGTSSGATLDNITADLKAMINAMLSVNMPMSRPVWIMNPTNVNALRFIRDGLGQYAYMEEISRGTIVGYPYLESTSMAATEIMLVDASQVIIASELAPQISISEDASLHMEDTSPADDIGGATTPVANMFQMDLTAVRAMSTIDWNVRHAGAVQVLDTVAWNG